MQFERTLTIDGREVRVYCDGHWLRCDLPDGMLTGGVSHELLEDMTDKEIQAAVDELKAIRKNREVQRAV